MMTACLIDAPYIPSFRDFSVQPGSLGISYTVSCVGHEVRVATLAEASVAIDTIIAEERERVMALLALPNIMF